MAFEAQGEDAETWRRCGSPDSPQTRGMGGWVSFLWTGSVQVGDKASDYAASMSKLFPFVDAIEVNGVGE
ncbi:hypothetical protein GCM10009712_38450 [Pseudarthrobacter sulfonivorans]